MALLMMAHTHTYTDIMGHRAHTPTDKQTNIFAPPTALCTPAADQSASARRGVGAGLLPPPLLLLLLPLLLLLLLLLLPGAAKATTMGVVVAEGCSSIF